MSQCLRLTQGLYQYQRNDCCPIDVKGGSSVSCLQQSERYLRSDSNVVSIMYYVELVNPDDVYQNYRSLVDLMISEFFVHHKAQCLAFYNDEGPSMIEIYTPDEIHLIDEALLSILKTARYYIRELEDDTFFISNLKIKNENCLCA